MTTSPPTKEQDSTSPSSKGSVPKRLAKEFLKAFALLLAVPPLLMFFVAQSIVGRDAAMQEVSQWLAPMPGILGRYLRGAFLQFTLQHYEPTAVVEYGVLFSKAGTEIEDHVYIGPYSQIGWAHIGRDTLVASGVQILSGPKTHGMDDLTIPIREQPGELRQVRIGVDCWIGAGAIVMADVGDHTVVAAGAVVTQALPDGVIAAGIPARVIRSREPQDTEAT
jgi:acetyltransferase-like isoleucine patch superfamily enzyme